MDIQHVNIFVPSTMKCIGMPTSRISFSSAGGSFSKFTSVATCAASSGFGTTETSEECQLNEPHVENLSTQHTSSCSSVIDVSLVLLEKI